MKRHLYVEALENRLCLSAFNAATAAALIADIHSANTNGAAANTIIGSGGDDTIDGGVGNDQIEGNAGDDTLSGERLIGVIQPSIEEEMISEPAPELYPLGCAGRIVQYAEIGDGRCFLTLMGVARFHMAAEAPSQGPYRVAVADYSPFAEDFLEGAGEAAVDREDLLETLKRFAEVNEIKVVWSDIKKASNEALVNGLSMMSPCGPREKQALLEARDLKSRAEMLVAITTIELARGQDAATQIH